MILLSIFSPSANQACVYSPSQRKSTCRANTASLQENFLLFFFFSYTRSCYAVQACPELTMEPMLASKSQESFGLSFLNAGIIVGHHHTQQGEKKNQTENQKNSPKQKTNNNKYENQHPHFFLSFDKNSKERVFSKIYLRNVLDEGFIKLLKLGLNLPPSCFSLSCS